MCIFIDFSHGSTDVSHSIPEVTDRASSSSRGSGSLRAQSWIPCSRRTSGTQVDWVCAGQWEQVEERWFGRGSWSSRLGSST